MAAELILKVYVRALCTPCKHDVFVPFCNDDGNVCNGGYDDGGASEYHKFVTITGIVDGVSDFFDDHQNNRLVMFT